jgi:DNA-binding Xre family transcriptional regulator
MKGSVVMNIGDAVRVRIQELLDEKGITLNKLAINSGITQSTLNNIMSGRNKSTTVSTVKKICDGLEITIIDFFNSEIFKNLEQEIK